jgi:2'-hydroxyisoflavone reductase
VRILILGGTSFVGRAITLEATSRGHQVTTFTRSTLPPGATEGLVETLFGDRIKPNAYAFAAGRQWDVVIDTWFTAPKVVHESATKLRDHAPYYAYISTCSVYDADPLPSGVSEDFQTVLANPSAESTNYPADKRGAELAVLSAFGAERSLIARPGLILGPHEWPARLAWWLRRIAEGGEVLAPGPKDLPLQYIDARDLAIWLVASIEKNLTGTFNTLAPAGHSTMQTLLELCKSTTASDAHFTWVPTDFLLEHEIEPWSELPIWITPNMYGFYNFDESKACAAGLLCRPIHQTVEDTWQSLLTEPQSELPPGRIPPGVSKEKELSVLAAWAATL